MADFVPGYEASGFAGTGAPKGAPAEIIDRLNREINAGLADPRIKARIVELGGTMVGGSPAEFEAKLFSHALTTPNILLNGDKACTARPIPAPMVWCSLRSTLARRGCGHRKISPSRSIEAPSVYPSVSAMSPDRRASGSERHHG